jgi:hypothetical protein
MSVPMLDPLVARKRFLNPGSRSGASWDLKVLNEFLT